MRDAFGGAFMLKIALVFFVVYVCFMAMAINYAKAFRIKNRLVNIIEQYQYNGQASDTEPAIKEINKYLEDAHQVYADGESNSKKSTCEKMYNDEAGLAESFYYTKNGACIITYGTMGAFGESSRYYKVATFLELSIPFLGIGMTIPISGETKIIYINN